MLFNEQILLSLLNLWADDRLIRFELQLFIDGSALRIFLIRLIVLIQHQARPPSNGAGYIPPPHFRLSFTAVTDHILYWAIKGLAHLLLLPVGCIAIQLLNRHLIYLL